MKHKDFLKNFQVTKYEMIFCFVIIGSIAIGTGFMDGVLFDTYVKPDMQGVSDWHAVGVAYQGIMQGFLIWIALGLAGFRIFSGLMAGATFTPILLFTGGLWFASTLIFHNTGFTDYFYYKLRNLEIPSDLDWLNEMGIYQWIRFATGNENVNPTDLYIGMFIGILLLLTMWFVAIHHYKKGSLKVLERAL